MAEEAIDPPRHVPRSIMYVVLAVFAIYAFLPSVALSALPVHGHAAGGRQRDTYQCPARTLRSATARPIWPASTPATLWPAWSSTSACPRRSPRPRLLRGDPGRDDPDHRHQRRHHRRLAADLLDGPAPAAARDHPPRPPQLQHALRRDHRLQRGRGRADGAQRRDRLPRQPVRVRRDALVHAGARLGDLDAPHDARPRTCRGGGRPRSGCVATTCPRSRSSADWARFAVVAGDRLPPRLRLRGAGRSCLAGDRHGAVLRLPPLAGPAADRRRCWRPRLRGRAGDRGRVPLDPAADQLRPGRRR